MSHKQKPKWMGEWKMSPKISFPEFLAGKTKILDIFVQNEGFSVHQFMIVKNSHGM